jgi:hypothetical protein
VVVNGSQPAAAKPRDVNVVNTDRTPWEEVITVQQGDQGGTAGVLVEKVPANEILVLTDVVMTHNVITTTSTFRANIRRGPASNATDCDTAGLVLGPYVRPEETVSINLTTGVVFEPDEQICVVVGGAVANQGITFTFIGYFVED